MNIYLRQNKCRYTEETVAKEATRRKREIVQFQTASVFLFFFARIFLDAFVVRAISTGGLKLPILSRRDCRYDDGCACFLESSYIYFRRLETPCLCRLLDRGIRYRFRFRMKNFVAMIASRVKLARPEARCRYA